VFLVQNFDGQFGVEGILELSFEEPRWGLIVSGEEINRASRMKKLWDMGPSLILRSNVAVQMLMQNLLGTGGFFHGFRV
jgi:hypothetical protein